jgi:hypothetical protein
LFQKCSTGIQKRIIWCRFWIRWKRCKKSSTKKWHENNFYWVIFCTFFNGFKLTVEFCILWYPYWIFNNYFVLLILALFDNFKAKIGQNGLKNEKHILQMCVRISLKKFFQAGRLHFEFLKSENCCIPMIMGLYTVKKVCRFSCHQPGCHRPNSPCRNYSWPWRVWSVGTATKRSITQRLCHIT